MVFQELDSGFSETTMRKERDPEKWLPVFRNIMLKQRPAAIRPLGITGKVPVRLERMDAIRNIKTMAGSPDADRVSASRNLAHGFYVLGAPFFREPMKEDPHV
jgi:hypothetical protein